MSGEIVKFEPLLDEDRVAKLLGKYDGNVAKVADFMGVTSGRLRRFIESRPALVEIIDDAFEDAVDEAIGVLFEGLRDKDHFANRFYAAKEFLRSSSGRRRGFGQPTHGNIMVEAKGASIHQTIELKWIEPPEKPAHE